jgi:DNA-binding transcriptional LysR family regulator
LVVGYRPDDHRLASTEIYTDHLAFVVSPQHRFAGRESVSIRELGMETFIAHNVLSPYRETVLREFQRHKARSFTSSARSAWFRRPAGRSATPPRLSWKW